jgi:peptidoglycan/xylan/chitin deacetylase (PgdA/CDA1 family)
MAISIFDIPVLTYHNISNQWEWGLNSIPPIKFEKQMRYLADEGYQPITFIDFYSGNISQKPIIITFDDGYESVYHNAFSILKRFNFTAVVFIITNFIGELNGWDANIGGIKFRHLNKNQIKVLSDNGIEIGSHGATHRSFPFLKKEIVKDELVTSQLYIQNITKKRILTLAYPFGNQNFAIQKLAKETGYKFGCINLWGSKTKKNNYCLKRLPVYRTDSMKAFQNKLTKNWRHQTEIIKLSAISWPARLTPLYQKLIKRIY